MGTVSKYIENSVLLQPVRVVLSCFVMSDSLRPHGLKPARTLCLWAFSRQEYWSGFSCPSPGNLAHPGIEPESLALADWFVTTEPPGKPLKAAAAAAAKSLQSCPTLCDPIDGSPPAMYS